jgi:hypothetical protein
LTAHAGLDNAAGAALNARLIRLPANLTRDPTTLLTAIAAAQ